MSLIKWDDSLSVSIDVIDKEHKKLIGMINDLHEALKQGKGRTVIGRILNEMFDYSNTHFKTEEKYFDLYKYPDSENHKKKHVSFIERVSEFKSGFDKGELSLTIEVMDFLSNWLQDHIKRIDRGYSKFFNEKGLT